MNRIQIIAIIASFVFLFLIIELIRKKKIKEQYSLLWLFFAVIFVLISIFKEILESLAHILGIAYTPAAFLLVLIAAVILILIQYSIVISSLSEKNKNLIQEVGLLKMQLDELKEKLNHNKEDNGTIG